MKKPSIFIILILLLSSHELFLKTDSHFLSPEREHLLYLFNGTFDLSENIITRDRIINSQIHGPNYLFEPKAKDYFDKGDITFLRWKTGISGSYVAGISTLPRTLELSAKDFMDYLEHEGLTNVIIEREKKGIQGKSAKEKYSKHVKALLQVGTETSMDYAKVLGFPIEFVPINNPYALKKGEELSFQLLWRGQPLANQIVHYSYQSANKKTEVKKSVLTDNEGNIQIKAERKGQWFLSTIFMEESLIKDLDYESNWATITFEVK